MPKKCHVCGKYSSKDDKSRSLHRWPTKISDRKLWLEQLGVSYTDCRVDCSSRNLHICSDHFLNEDFSLKNWGAGFRRYLKCDAKPKRKENTVMYDGMKEVPPNYAAPIYSAELLRTLSPFSEVKIEEQSIEENTPLSPSITGYKTDASLTATASEAEDEIINPKINSPKVLKSIADSQSAFRENILKWKGQKKREENNIILYDVMKQQVVSNYVEPINLAEPLRTVEENTKIYDVIKEEVLPNYVEPINLAKPLRTVSPFPEIKIEEPNNEENTLTPPIKGGGAYETDASLTETASEVEDEILNSIKINSPNVPKGIVDNQSVFGRNNVNRKLGKKRKTSNEEQLVTSMTSSDFSTPEKQRKNLKILKKIVADQKRKIDSLNRTIRRLNLRRTSQKHVINLTWKKLSHQRRRSSQ